MWQLLERVAKSPLLREAAIAALAAVVSALTREETKRIS